MHPRFFALCTAAVVAFAIAGPASAADAKPPADPSKPVTTARVGGSPADAAFRDAQQKSGTEYRDARTACKAKPRPERGACMSAARAQLKQARLDAKTAHDTATKAAHDAAKKSP